MTTTMSRPITGDGGDQTEIGDLKTFAPHGFYNFENPQQMRAAVKVTGTVVEIHQAHRWYRVRYQLPEGGPYYYECFKF